MVLIKLKLIGIKIFKITTITNKEYLKIKSLKLIINKQISVFNKITDIRNKIKNITEYLNILYIENKDEKIINLINKQKDILNYLNIYHDKYCSLFLKLCFQEELQILNNININKINVTEYINSLRNDIKNIVEYIYEINNIHSEIDIALTEINNEITNIMTSLISYKSKAILETISPVDDKYTNDMLQIIIENNINFGNTIDDQYERFIQEINVLNSNY